MGLILHSVAGLVGLIALAWVLSEDRRHPPWRLVIAGLGLQIAVAALLLRLPAAADVFVALNDAALALEAATREGTAFVFGYLAGDELPFALAADDPPFILAFQALPLILVVSALSALLYYWRVLPAVVSGLSWVLGRAMGIGGALGLTAAANVFAGMTEAPLLIRPYLRTLSRFELMALMVCGMATIAGTMMVLYASILEPALPNSLGHIMTASLISVPAALMIGGLMVPPGRTAAPSVRPPPSEASGSLDAIVRGTRDGLWLLANVVAILIVTIALVSLINRLLGAVALPWNDQPASLQLLLAPLLQPFMWLMGIPWGETATAAELMATKIVLNELIAYSTLAELPAAALSERSTLILTYSLCGFANLGSLGIMIGGLGSLVPERQSEIVSLGLRALVGGLLATALTGLLAGLLA